MINRIFVRGDTHRNFDFLSHWCKDNNTTMDDILIILGDAGINYCLDSSDYYLKKYISQQPITLVCVHGNHEVRPGTISSYELKMIKDFGCECWVEPKFPNIVFPKDGKMVINGLSFLVLGGAYSADKSFRLAYGYKWFKDEQMSDEDMTRIKKLIEKENKFDYVLSHTAPQSFEPTELFLPFGSNISVDKRMEIFLQKVEGTIEYGKWLFGHYHGEKEIADKARLLFNQIILLEKA